MLDSYLNLEGILHRDLRFVPLRAEESRYLLAQPAAQADAVMAELRDADGATLLTRACEVRFPQGCDLGPEQATQGLLRVSLPRHPQARELLLLHAGRVLHAAKIAVEPPRIDLAAHPGGAAGTLRFRCKVSDANAVLVFLVIDSNGRAYAADPKREGDLYSLALAPFAGGGECRLRVQATSGLRTAQADGPGFETPDAIVTGRIVEPRADTDLAPDRPLSLIGNLSIEQNGRSIPWDAQQTHWVVDGKSELRGQCVAVDALEPGAHVIALWHGSNAKNRKLLAQVTVKTRPRTELELELAKVLERRAQLPARPPAPKPVSGMTARATQRRTSHGPCKCC